MPRCGAPRSGSAPLFWSARLSRSSPPCVRALPNSQETCRGGARQGELLPEVLPGSFLAAPRKLSWETGTRQSLARSFLRQMFRQLLGDCAWEPCPGDRDKAKHYQELSERPCLGDLPGRPGQGNMIPEALPGRSFVCFLETAPGRLAWETGTRQNVTRSSARQVFVRSRESASGRPARECRTRRNVTRSSPRQVFRQLPGGRA
jgi:hypothetical protein